MKKKNIGSSANSWLREDGIYEEVSTAAIKRALARQVEASMVGRRSDAVVKGRNDLPSTCLSE